MLQAALCVSGRVVAARDHTSCFGLLSAAEQDGDIDSGFFDPESREFISERERRIFDRKEVYLVRHGHRLADGTDPDLDETGTRQALAAAEHLLSCHTGSCVGVTSPLLRCLRTAAVLQDLLRIPFRVVPEVAETPGADLFRLRSRAADFPSFEWPAAKEWHVLPETPHAFYERVRSSLRDLPDRCIVVTHQGYIRLVARLALYRPLADGEIPEASVTHLYRQDAGVWSGADAKLSDGRSAA